MHWTLPYDVFALGIVTVLKTILPEKTAFLWGTGVSAAVSYAMLVVAVHFLAIKTGGGRAAWLAGPAVASATGLYAYSQIGRNDHHVLLLVPIVIAFSLLAAEKGDEEKRPAKTALRGAAAGLLAAAALWISVEPLPLILFLAVSAVVARSIGKIPRGFIAALVAGIVAGTAAALAIDPPAPNPMAAEIDRLSVVFLAFSAAIAAGLAIADAVVARRPAAPAKNLATGLLRHALPVLPIALCLLAWLAAFPAALAGPEAIVGERLTKLWWNAIQEIRPLRSAIEISVFAWFPIAVLGLSFHSILRPSRAKDADELAERLLASLALAAFLALAMAHLRFATHANVVALIVFLKIAAKWKIIRSAPESDSIDRLPHLVLGFPALAAAIILAAGILGAPDEPAKDAAAPPAKTVCDGKEGLRLLSEELSGNEPLMTTIMDAPTLLYLTKHPVVAGPYQRNVQGLTDLYDFFQSVGDDETARKMLARRGIEHVFLCLSSEGKAVEPAIPDAGPSLHARLRQGDVPEWLKPRQRRPWQTGNHALMDVVPLKADEGKAR